MKQPTLTSPADVPASSALLHLLDADLRFAPTIQRFYSDHMAMMLVALDQLGAPADVLQDRFDRHAAGPAEPRTDRRQLDVVRREVEQSGIASAVATALPALVDAPATALFHPAIRLSYALDVGHAGQVAAALLDWRTRHDPLPVPVGEPGGKRLADVARELADHRPGTFPTTFDLAGIARRPELRAALDGLAIDDRTLDEVSAFALASHVTAEAFVTLHLVTGARAVRAISGWLDEETALTLAAHTARAMVVAYAAVGAPTLLSSDQLDAIRERDLPPPEAIATRVIADRDPHVVKLADVALIEDVRSRDRLYRYVAARAVDLTPRDRP